MNLVAKVGIIFFFIFIIFVVHLVFIIKKTPKMNENELLEAAKLIFLRGSTRGQVIDFLIENGIEDEKAASMATNAYLAIKDQVPKRVPAESADEGFPSWLIYVGVLILINVLSAMFGWGFWIY